MKKNITNRFQSNQIGGVSSISSTLFDPNKRREDMPLNTFRSNDIVNNIIQVNRRFEVFHCHLEFLRFESNNQIGV